MKAAVRMPGLGGQTLSAATTLLLAIGLAGTAAGSAHTAPTPLHRTCLAGTCIEIPARWHWHNESYPSDHATFVAKEPHGGWDRIVEIASGCTCGGHADLRGLAPPGTVASWGPGKLAFAARPVVLYYAAAPEHRLGAAAHDPLPVHGLVVMPSAGLHGYTLVCVFLPTRDRGTATRILRSFTLQASRLP